MTALIARSNVQSVYWVGTSMGGLIGMMLAAQPATLFKAGNQRCWPLVPKAALERLAMYVGKASNFSL
jgi:pimeloyl-ACP methyl ester carboxylesterase